MPTTRENWIVESAYEAGYQTGWNPNGRLSQNPYSDGWEKFSWDQGYQDARAGRPCWTPVRAN